MTKNLPAKRPQYPPDKRLPLPGMKVRVIIEYDDQRYVTDGTFHRADWATKPDGTQWLTLQLRKEP